MAALFLTSIDDALFVKIQSSFSTGALLAWMPVKFLSAALAIFQTIDDTFVLLTPIRCCCKFNSISKNFLVSNFIRR